jgi:hypothetical protein
MVLLSGCATSQVNSAAALNQSLISNAENYIDKNYSDFHNCSFESGTTVKDLGNSEYQIDGKMQDTGGWEHTVSEGIQISPNQTQYLVCFLWIDGKGLVFNQPKQEPDSNSQSSSEAILPSSDTESGINGYVIPIPADSSESSQSEEPNKAVSLPEVGGNITYDSASSVPSNSSEANSNITYNSANSASSNDSKNNFISVTMDASNISGLLSTRYVGDDINLSFEIANNGNYKSNSIIIKIKGNTEGVVFEPMPSGKINGLVWTIPYYQIANQYGISLECSKIGKYKLTFAFYNSDGKTPLYDESGKPIVESVNFTIVNATSSHK